MTVKEQATAGVTQNLMRLGVGIEHIVISLPIWIKLLKRQIVEQKRKNKEIFELLRSLVSQHFFY